MPDISHGWGQLNDVDPDRQWREARLRRVRDYIKAHSQVAHHLPQSDYTELTRKQFLKTPLLHCTNSNHKPEYIMSVEIFRDKVCDRMPWKGVLRTLMNERLLNGGRDGGLVYRRITEAVGRVCIVSIKPKILRFMTTLRANKTETFTPREFRP